MAKMSLISSLTLVLKDDVINTIIHLKEERILLRTTTKNLTFRLIVNIRKLKF